MTEDSLDQLVLDTAEAPFFFEKDIEDDIEALRDKGGDLLYAAKERPNERSRDKAAPAVWTQDTLIDWFARQPKNTPDLFKPYLTKGVK